MLKRHREYRKGKRNASYWLFDMVNAMSLRGRQENLNERKGSGQNFFFFIYIPLVYFRDSATLLSRRSEVKKS